ncbi:hypothetical protein [Sinorhizobium sp. NFACC03]|uniref:hypothetical protein n=1 Tax=Sinorhizobium sp. NFACC03 TaxID=1566295 RepID=UPI000884873C|nr:hypothetical protein [Sinorhizobium sp. NFACC03]SDA87400.1 Fur family transcriptional regulator, zinc uptake regulator [Sinorhizobium sp. NFACC03]
MNVQRTPLRRPSPPSPRIIAKALEHVARTCRDRGLQFTAIRRQVLETLIHAGQPLGAYELMADLEGVLGFRQRSTGHWSFCKSSASSRASRAETLLSHARILIMRMPAFFFICETCGASAEVENPTIESAVNHDAASLGFRIARRVVELQGTCGTCLVTGGPAAFHHHP